jgi:predicted GTPase
LIEFKGNGFLLNEEAMEILNSIEEDIIVVSVVGKARTGKSYLMNLLLDNIGKNQGVIIENFTNHLLKLKI